METNIELSKKIISELKKIFYKDIKKLTKQKEYYKTLEKYNLYKNDISQKENKIYFPRKGIIAGQAVTEIYFRLMNIHIQTRIKDIDVFILDNEEKNYFSKLESNEKKYKQVLLETEYEEQKILTYEKNNYKINNVYEIGNLNIIKINSNKGEDTNKLLKTVIESFDINAIKIGIDIKTKELYISEDFKDFLKTKQLKIVHYQDNPLKNYIRFLKKTEYYKGKVFFDKKYELQLIIPYIYLNQKIKNYQMKIKN